MNFGFGAIVPATDLLDVFNSLNGSALFPGLTVGVGGQPSILGRIGWIFTGFGAVLVLWGFVLRTRNRQGQDKGDEIARTLLVIASILLGPLLMRIAMQGADGLYDSAIGNPRNLCLACIKAVSAMPEVSTLFDPQRQLPSVSSPAGAAGPSAGSPSPVKSPSDGSVLGYVEAFGTDLWHTASGSPFNLGGSWSALRKVLMLANGLQAGLLKGLFIGLTSILLYGLLLAAAAIIWFMVQLRYFLAVTGTMMLPLFLGLLSLPEGHPNRGTGHAYIMNLLSVALWPVAWTVGHTGTIAFYDALISLMAGASRVPAFADLLQWSSVTSPGSISAAQAQSLEAALGNWLMGDLTALLAPVVGGIGFMVWVLMVSVSGPIFLHKLLTTGALFMNQAVAAAGRSMWDAVGEVSTGVKSLTRPGPMAEGGADTGALPRSSAGQLEHFPAPPDPFGSPDSPGGTTMAQAALPAAAPSSPLRIGP